MGNLWRMKRSSPGVLAHETAHVVARHGTQQLSRERLVSFFTSLGDVLYVGLSSPLPSVVTGVESLSYGRADETQADELATQYLHQARCHPEGLATFSGRLRESGQWGRLERFLSTHPVSADRAKRLRAWISAWTLDGRWTRDSREAVSRDPGDAARPNHPGRRAATPGRRAAASQIGDPAVWERIEFTYT